MTQKLQTSKLRRMAVNTFALLSLIAVTLSSCTKKESSSGNDGAKFVGTWTGTSSSCFPHFSEI